MGHHPVTFVAVVVVFKLPLVSSRRTGTVAIGDKRYSTVAFENRDPRTVRLAVEKFRKK